MASLLFSQFMVPFMLIFYVLLIFPAFTVHGLPTIPIAPPITYPTKGVVWTVGSKQSVTWDTSALPPGSSAVTAELILGWLDSTGENLQLNKPLATNVSVIQGQTTITVPDYPLRDNYIICLFGDSGDISANFTIKGGSGTVSSMPPPPSTVTSSSTPVGPSTVSVVSTDTGPSTVEMSSSPSSSGSVVSGSPSLLSVPHSSGSSTTSTGTNLAQSSTPSPTSTGHTSAAITAYTYDSLLLSLVAVSLAAHFF